VVASTAGPGTVYQFSACVRSDSSRGQCFLRVRERNIGTDRGWVESSPVQLAPWWQKLELDYASHEAGSSLNLQIAGDPDGKAQSMCVDAVEVHVVPPSTPSNPATDPGAGRGARMAQFGAAGAGAGGIGPLQARVLPDPVRTLARLMFSTSRPGLVSVRIFDPGGRLVRRLLDGIPVETGNHVATIDGRSDDGTPLTEGVYYYQIRSIDGLEVGRFVILR